jgi:hypothetical protein
VCDRWLLLLSFVIMLFISNILLCVEMTRSRAQTSVRTSFRVRGRGGRLTRSRFANINHDDSVSDNRSEEECEEEDEEEDEEVVSIQRGKRELSEVTSERLAARLAERVRLREKLVKSKREAVMSHKSQQKWVRMSKGVEPLQSTVPTGEYIIDYIICISNNGLKVYVKWCNYDDPTWEHISNIPTSTLDQFNNIGPISHYEWLIYLKVRDRQNRAALNRLSKERTCSDSDLHSEDIANELALPCHN